MQVLSDIDLLQILQLECLSVLFPHIFALSKAVEVEYQVHKLLIGLVIVERNNGNSIVQLVAERINSVVHDNEIFQVAVGYNSQIFHVNTLFGPDTMVPIEPELD